MGCVYSSFLSSSLCCGQWMVCLREIDSAKKIREELGVGELCYRIKWHKTRFFEQKICHQGKNMPPNTPFTLKSQHFQMSLRCVYLCCQQALPRILDPSC